MSPNFSTNSVHERKQMPFMNFSRKVMKLALKMFWCLSRRRISKHLVNFITLRR